MKTKIILILILMFLVQYISAQKIINGYVYEYIDKKETAIPLANIYWQGTTNAVVANEKGSFKISEPENYPANLIVSFVGYQSDTINFQSYKKNIKVKLVSTVNLDEFSVTEKQSGTFINTIDPIHVETITSKELQKAACCNISESFETNASVDVNFTDAVSGRKKIEMLGLDGIYTQIQYENLPLIRGLGTAYGMSFVPGTWAESIQVKKGAGSVVNGYESITGQINIEFLKPDKSDKLYINGYGNAMSRAEINIHSAQKINGKWSSLTFLHANDQSIDHHRKCRRSPRPCSPPTRTTPFPKFASVWWIWTKVFRSGATAT